MEETAIDPWGALELLAAIIVTARREAGQGRADAQEFMRELAELPRPRNMRLIEGEGSMLRGPGHPAGGLRRRSR